MSSDLDELTKIITLSLDIEVCLFVGGTQYIEPDLARPPDQLRINFWNEAGDLLEPLFARHGLSAKIKVTIAAVISGTIRTASIRRWLGRGLLHAMSHSIAEKYD
jgi:hypothetical protein